MTPRRFVTCAVLLPLPALAMAADGSAHDALNLSAVLMFLVFVGATLGITWWASRRSQSRADFYTAGGSITGFQNGLGASGPPKR